MDVSRDSPVESGTLAVPGARLYYEVRGVGPVLLLLAGGNSDAVIFDGLAAILAADYRVVTCDPRGNSRSALDGPPAEQRIEVHADDSCRLLRHLAVTEPVRAFGSCSGGLVALELAVRHPELVEVVVAHEPPALRLLPGADGHLAFIDRVVDVFRAEGPGPAMAELSALYGGRPAPDLPQERDNTAFFLAHALRPFTRFVPDLAALAGLADRVLVAGGRDSRTQTIHRPAVVLAERLGHELAEFPGGHVGYATWPGDFALRLAGVLAAVPTR